MHASSFSLNASSKRVAALICLLLLANPAVAETDAQEDDPFPFTVPVLPVPHYHPTACKRLEPATGRLALIPVEGVGAYAAYGSRSLIPGKIFVSLGEGPPIIGRVLFGAETDFVLPASIELRGSPSDVGEHPRGMASQWGGKVKHDADRQQVTYRLPLTSTVWELLGKDGKTTCLYFKKSG